MNITSIKRLRAYAAVLILAVSLICLTVFSMRITAPDQIGEPEIVSYSTEYPQENPPGISYIWKGLPTSPRKIRYEKLGVNAYIQNVGVDQKRQIAVPNNIHVAGWFVESAPVGTDGLSIIDGHVDGRKEKGIFNRLADAQKDDELSIELGDGSIVKYRVIDIQTVSAEEAASILFSQSPAVKSQLNLITCGGDFDAASQQYKKRVIVFTEKI